MLRRLRSGAALSQEALAERAGLSKRGISDLERGARLAPRLETVRLLADGLALGDTDRQALLAAARPALLGDDALGLPPAVPITEPGMGPVLDDVSGGTVTWLVTDLAETRRLWREHGAAMPAVSARYEVLVRTAAATHGGTVEHDRGTALQFRFPTVSAAVAAALDAQQALRREAWEDTGLPEPTAGAHGVACRNGVPGSPGHDTLPSPDLSATTSWPRRIPGRCSSRRLWPRCCRICRRVRRGVAGGDAAAGGHGAA